MVEGVDEVDSEEELLAVPDSVLLLSVASDVDLDESPVDEVVEEPEEADDEDDPEDDSTEAEECLPLQTPTSAPGIK